MEEEREKREREKKRRQRGAKQPGKDKNVTEKCVVVNERAGEGRLSEIVTLLERHKKNGVSDGLFLEPYRNDDVIILACASTHYVLRATRV